MSDQELRTSSGTDALKEVESHELLYAERRALEAGNLAGVLESLQRRQDITRTSVFGLCIAQVVLLVVRFLGSGAKEVGVPWSSLFVLLIAVAIAIQTHGSYRRTTSALGKIRDQHDAN